jgi:hypothetical protein
MSKRHQSSRRRSYGRRQHELHERTDRLVGVADWLGESDSSQAERRWTAAPVIRGAAEDWLQLQGID